MEQLPSRPLNKSAGGTVNNFASWVVRQNVLATGGAGYNEPHVYKAFRAFRVSSVLYSAAFTASCEILETSRII